MNYSPAIGTPLSTLGKQTLSVTFVPDDSTDFKTVTTSVPIDVVSAAPPPPANAMVIAEVPVFQRKLNKHGKPTGKAVLTGFTLDYNMPLTAADVSDAANYALDTLTLKKVKKSEVRVAHPLKNFTVSYTPETDSVTLNLTGRPRHSPAAARSRYLPVGVTDNSGSVLTGTTVFKITAGGKKVEPS